MTPAFGLAEAKALVPAFVQSANNVSSLKCLKLKFSQG